MSTCPACGVAVVPGYVKCPKCGRALPALARTKSNTFGSGGGTAVTDRASSRTMWIALGAGLAIAIGLVVVLGGRGGSKTVSAQNPSTVEPTQPQPTTQPTNDPGPSDDPTPTQPVAVAGADTQQAVEDLDRELKRAKLWGKAEVVEQRIDVRSGNCDDAAMAPLIDSVRSRLHGVGLTKLRCLAQSGVVVFERDL